jgi:hypothetical protein
MNETHMTSHSEERRRNATMASQLEESIWPESFKDRGLQLCHVIGNKQMQKSVVVGVQRHIQRYQLEEENS